MSGTCKRAAFAMVGATGMLMVPAASAGAGPAPGPAVLVRIESASQKEILARGLEVLVSNKGAGRPIVRVSGSSSTLDVPDFTWLTKTRAVGLREAKASAPSQRVTAVRLRLTTERRKQIASCEGQDPVGGGRRWKRPGKTGARHEAMQAEAGRSQPCRSLRLHRRTRRIAVSPPSVPRRLLHSRRSLDPNRAADRSQDRRDAAERHRQADRRRALQPQRRLQPGQAIVLRVPGLDNPEAFEKTDPVPIGRIGRYAEPHAPIVLIDAHTGERAPIFVEIDSNASEPQSTALMIQPATKLTSGHRFIVALRDLKDADGKTIGLPEGFRDYRDRLPTRRAPIKRRRAGSGARTCTSPGTSPSRQRRVHRGAGAEHARRCLRPARRRRPLGI